MNERVEAFVRELWETSSHTRSRWQVWTDVCIRSEEKNDLCVIQCQVTMHLSQLLNKSNRYFRELTKEQSAPYTWISNLFTANIEEDLPPTSPSMLLEVKLTRVCSEGSKRASFNEVQLEIFY